MGTLADKLNKTYDTKRQIAAAIEEMTGKNPGTVFADYPDAIRAIPTGGGGWTGHADVEGLKAIGWTDEDIAYYQQYGVNWNEEDDAYHLVPEDNKALYGVINIDNIREYKDILVYLPKIDTTGVTSMQIKFSECIVLVAIPKIDTSNVLYMTQMFSNCSSLVCVPVLNTSNVLSTPFLYSGCSSLLSAPMIDTSKSTNMLGMYRDCSSSKVTNMQGMFSGCARLVNINYLDVGNVTNVTSMLANCRSLRFCNLKNLKLSIDISATSLLEKSSLLYMIENAAPTSSITITLSAYCYNKFSTDADVLAALSAQPLVSLASAA